MSTQGQAGVRYFASAVKSSKFIKNPWGPLCCNYLELGGSEAVALSPGTLGQVEQLLLLTLGRDLSELLPAPCETQKMDARPALASVSALGCEQMYF